ncbi:ABC transporter permease [Anaerocolumna aminovalerica]|uniref:ABC transporter permease n=1 Tax=Anaerocolumna aminovalerica TaxID=1527 RepID=UPI001FA84842|nr:ABC transporter permease [Anaerocolumna aminovalerica]
MALASLICCELLKLKRAKILLISFLGAMATPFMMFIEALQTHFEHPEQVIRLVDLYDSSLVYVMLLMNMMVYVIISAYLFSREYTEKTLKMILPVPISKTKFIASKFIILFLWIMVLTITTWAGILLSAALYHVIFGMTGFVFEIALERLGIMLVSGILMFLTISPFSYLTVKAKNLVTPMIAAAAIVMGSAALSNQELGALYPWTATYFLLKGKLASTGYPPSLAIVIIALVSILGFLTTFVYFKKEDIK